MTGGGAADVLERLARQQELLRSVRDEMDGIAVRVSSADGSIEAEVDGRGELTGLWLTEQAYVNGPANLARGIVAAARGAARLAAARQHELATRLSAELGRAAGGADSPGSSVNGSAPAAVQTQ